MKSKAIIIYNTQAAIILWGKLVAHSPFASPFQTFDYYSAINTLQNFSADVFAVEESGEYTSLVVVTVQQEPGVKGYFSRRGIIYGGPLVRGDGDSLETLLHVVRKHYAGKLIYLESRHYFDYSRHHDAFSRSGWVFQPYLNSRKRLDLPMRDELVASFSSNRRREIRQSLNEGAIAREITSAVDVAGVYEILANLYQTRVRLPIPAPEFFHTLWQSGIMKGFIVEHDGKTIGGAFCPILPGRAIYTMYYCGFRNYHKNVYPTHLAILAAMEYGLSAGCEYLDFMGAGKPGVEYGVRQYKLGFGGDLHEDGRYLLVFSRGLYTLGKIGIKILSKLRR
jgi:hypothetical protein